MRSKDQILRSALRLSYEDRSELLQALLLSLEAPPGVLVAGTPHYREVIARRAKEVVDGRARTVDGFRLVDRSIRKLRAKAKRK